ncbi:Lrp/AsnC family transcriptional regulator [Nocardia sp. NBC_01329]|uniref:Lrp/AsnC family transcriptional regulator n=1 Tax=Nocardia sp. NBC_01329 TaxID=2903594 RepID=UPI002E10646A|nr:AsnC family transcriptional regulator [Nocardia sp. NBC_01329]
MDPVMLDAVDQRLLHALQIDARAPFSTIAAVLDISDRTVARRFGRLRATGALRISAVPHHHVAAEARWLVRLRVRPHGAAAVARALAARPDTAWVTELSAGAEIVCLFCVPDAGMPPLATLSRHPDIVDVTAQRLLRQLMADRWRGRTSALTEQQLAGIPARGPAAPAPIRLTDLDHRLFRALAADGRTACADLARRVDWSESAVRRRLTELRDAGVLRFDIEVEPASFGYSTQCVLWLSVGPALLTTVAASLAADPETAYLGAITGSHNLFAVTICRDTEALYTYLTDRIAALPGIERVETAQITSYAKRFAPAGVGRAS